MSRVTLTRRDEHCLEIAMARASTLSVLLAATVLATACGDEKQTCKWVALNLTPPSASANHTAASPNNEAQFAANAAPSSGCLVPECINCTPGVTWTVSDPVNVSISPVENQSVAIATCMGATASPVAITATAPASTGTTETVSGTATLTCQ